MSDTMNSSVYDSVSDINITKIGIIGDGQLAKMLIESSYYKYGIKYSFYVLPLNLDNPKHDSLCFHLTNATIVDSYDELFEKSDIVTYEYENIDIDYMYKKGYQTVPSLECLKIIQNKIEQKKLYQDNGFNVPDTIFIGSGKEMFSYILENGTELNNTILKVAIGGYDGKGVMKLEGDFNDTHINDIRDFIDFDKQYMLEDCISIFKEVSVIVAISKEEIHVYQPVEMTMDDNNILTSYISPVRSNNADQHQISNIQSIAKEAVFLYQTTGIFAVEMFVSGGEELYYLNEISPRPHNTGHHTIESSNMSQYDALIRVLTHQKFVDNFNEKPCCLYNIIGQFNGYYDIDYPLYSKYDSISDNTKDHGYYIHMYGKKECKLNRKMGHITKLLSKKRKDDNKILNYNYNPYIKDINDIIIKCEISIIMGSSSDNSVVKLASNVLQKLNIPHHKMVLSAHRMPQHMVEYAKNIDKTCTKVIIACAGGAAHLPGMVASLTSLPVIGLPVKTSTLNGIDSLYSIVQMPRGVPVATVGINNGDNAALLACRILSIQDETIKENVKKYTKEQEIMAINSNSIV